MYVTKIVNKECHRWAMTKFGLKWIAGNINNFFNGHEQKFTKQQQVLKNVPEFLRTFNSQRYNKPSERCGAV